MGSTVLVDRDGVAVDHAHQVRPVGQLVEAVEDERASDHIRGEKAESEDERDRDSLATSCIGAGQPPGARGEDHDQADQEERGSTGTGGRVRPRASLNSLQKTRRPRPPPGPCRGAPAERAPSAEHWAPPSRASGADTGGAPASDIVAAFRVIPKDIGVPQRPIGRCGHLRSRSVLSACISGVGAFLTNDRTSTDPSVGPQYARRGGPRHAGPTGSAQTGGRLPVAIGRGRAGQLDHRGPGAGLRVAD